jgi:hypothetical protein
VREDVYLFALHRQILLRRLFHAGCLLTSAMVQIPPL